MLPSEPRLRVELIKMDFSLSAFFWGGRDGELCEDARKVGVETMLYLPLHSQKLVHNSEYT